MLYSYDYVTPKLVESVYLAPNATIIGDVEIGEHSSVWFSVVIRGDVSPIRIGERTNVQDGCIVHATYKKTEVNIGNGVTIGHGAIVHGCTIGDNSLIGMGAIILDGAQVGANCIIAAGALVREYQEIPANSLAAGVPAVVKRSLTAEEITGNRHSAENYVAYMRTYSEGEFGELGSR